MSQWMCVSGDALPVHQDSVANENVIGAIMPNRGIAPEPRRSDHGCESVVSETAIGGRSLSRVPPTSLVSKSAISKNAGFAPVRDREGLAAQNDSAPTESMPCAPDTRISRVQNRCLTDSQATACLRV